MQNVAVVILEMVNKICLFIWRSFAEEYGLRLKPLFGHLFVAFGYLGKFFPVE